MCTYISRSEFQGNVIHYFYADNFSTLANIYYNLVQIKYNFIKIKMVYFYENWKMENVN